MDSLLPRPKNTYIHLRYYSTIKNNEFHQLVPVRWMKYSLFHGVIEIQKEKNKYSIWNLEQILLMNLFAKEWRCRYGEWTCGLDTGD